jgi:hypothetical protein
MTRTHSAIWIDVRTMRHRPGLVAAECLEETQHPLSIALANLRGADQEPCVSISGKFYFHCNVGGTFDWRYMRFLRAPA